MKLQQRLSIAIAMIVLCTIGGQFFLNRSDGAVNTANKPKASAPATKQLPRLVDLGATKCIPCKMMAPILDELRTEYKGKIKVDFIDVWENPSEGNAYSVVSIPTQIFFDAKGKEVFRHMGYYPKDEIVKKFAELNFVPIASKPAPKSN